MRGTITFEKPREALTANERACVDWLAFNGVSPTVKAEDPKAPANIDLEIGSQRLKVFCRPASPAANDIYHVAIFPVQHDIGQQPRRHLRQA